VKHIPRRQGPLRIFDEDKDRLVILFLAKHSRSGGVPHPEDGTHAVYHHELLTTLRTAGLFVAAADRYDSIWEKPDADFVVPLLNRAGFLNSEMLAPSFSPVTASPSSARRRSFAAFRTTSI
jgi:D-alanine-D-alanine ligase